MFPTHDEPVRHIILFKKEESKTRDLTYLLLSIIRSETRAAFSPFQEKSYRARHRGLRRFDKYIE